MSVQNIFSDSTISGIVSAITVLVLSGMWAMLRSYLKRGEKSRKMINIKLESIVDAVEQSMNGQGKIFRVNYERRKQELMDEHKFNDED